MGGSPSPAFGYSPLATLPEGSLWNTFAETSLIEGEKLKSLILVTSFRADYAHLLWTVYIVDQNEINVKNLAKGQFWKKGLFVEPIKNSIPFRIFIFRNAEFMTYLQYSQLSIREYSMWEHDVFSYGEYFRTEFES